MDFDFQRLDGLRQGAHGAPTGGNVVITVADFRWLVDQLSILAPPLPVIFDEAAQDSELPDLDAEEID